VGQSFWTSQPSHCPEIRHGIFLASVVELKAIFCPILRKRFKTSSLIVIFWSAKVRLTIPGQLNVFLCTMTTEY
jgi:hypothetical protein